MKKRPGIFGTLRNVLASSWATKLIITLFVIEAVWIALSFRFPMLYDEAFHVDAIKLYAQQLSPFLTSQPTSYDIYGSMLGGGATLYHYLLGFPYRFIAAITDNLAVQVISLRLINILIAAAGLVVYLKLLRKIGIGPAVSNTALLIFVLLPIVPFVAATVNYDNLLLLLTGAFFLSTVKVFQSKSVDVTATSLTIILGCIAALAKSTFLPIFAFTVIVLAVVLLGRHGKKLFSQLWRAARNLRTVHLILLATGLILSIGWFSAIYVKNVTVYRSVQPSCEKTIGKDRCEKAGGVTRDQAAYETRHTRPLVQTPDYISMWMTQMANWTNMSGSRTADVGTVVAKPLPIIYVTVYVGGFLTLGLLLLAWRSLKPDASWKYLIGVAVVLAAFVFGQNYLTYIHLHMPYAIQPRYLLTIVPIIIAMALAGASLVFRKHRAALTIGLLSTLLLLTQGGGLVTHIIRSGDNWYWDNTAVRQVNDAARNILEPIVKGENAY